VASQEPYWAGASERAFLALPGLVPSMMTIHTIASLNAHLYVYRDQDAEQ